MDNACINPIFMHDSHGQNLNCVLYMDRTGTRMLLMYDYQDSASVCDHAGGTVHSHTLI